MLKKVKASHTRYRALGPELIPVYRQSARALQVTVSHPLGSRLPLLSTRPADTSPKHVCKDDCAYIQHQIPLNVDFGTTNKWY